MMLDLDRFKNVNDSLGHAAGDALLRQVAQRLKSTLRCSDVLARFGGDEFAIIQIGSGDQRNDSIRLATRIAKLIAEPFMLSGTGSKSVPASVSRRRRNTAATRSNC